MKLRCVFFAVSLTCGLVAQVAALANRQHISVAVLDFGNKGVGPLASQKLALAIASEPELLIVDRDRTRVAARGAGYEGSLNLTIQQARDLGAAIGCDFYFTGESRTLRRSPSTGPIFFESYASIFLVSTRSGRLILWERPSFRGATPEIAERQLLTELSSRNAGSRYLGTIQKAQEEERLQRQLAIDANTPVVDEAPAEADADTQSLRLPRPYRHLHPAYPDSAARAEAEGTVDVLVDLDKEGEVTRVEVVLWAGFGLDEATIDTVRQLHFFPAMRNGAAIPIRVLLRYNFGTPPRK